MRKIFYLTTFVGLAATGCRPANPIPKSRGYYRLELPRHAYRTFDSTSYPFSLSYPAYGFVTRDEALNRQEHAPYWINIDIPSLNATIYLSYKPISAAEPLPKLVDESYRLSFAHEKRADYIKTPTFRTKNGLDGVFYTVGGNAASAYQFYVTDNSKNFLRGALYFNNAPNADSLQPAMEFLKKDLEQMVESVRFK
ncbi:MAG: hypothetical protein QM642_07940 [Edaphocola sp.]